MTTTNIGSIDDTECGCNCSSSISDCSPCPEMSECWEITVSGVTIDNCDACLGFNGTYTIKHISSCLFKTDESNFDCSGSSSNEFLYEMTFGAGRFRVAAVYNNGSSNTTAAAWILAEASFDCTGVNILDLDQVVVCADWPTTIIISPINCS